MQPSHRRRDPMAWTPRVTLATRPATHAPSAYRGLGGRLAVVVLVAVAVFVLIIVVVGCGAA